MILYVAVAASLVGTDGLRLGVHESLVRLPGVALPLMIAQTMCVEGRVPLTALFRYLRKLKARGDIFQGDQRRFARYATTKSAAAKASKDARGDA